MEDEQSPEQKRDSIEIRRANPDEAEAIFNVQRKTWLATYPNEDAGITVDAIKERLEGHDDNLIPKKVNRLKRSIETMDETHTVFVARDGDNIVGYTAPNTTNGSRRIGAIYVLPEAQGKGIGSKLLKKAINWHGTNEDIYLSVASYNQNAIDFYSRHGFHKTDKLVVDDFALEHGFTPIPEIEMILKPA